MPAVGFRDGVLIVWKPRITMTLDSQAQQAVEEWDSILSLFVALPN